MAQYACVYGVGECVGCGECSSSLKCSECGKPITDESQHLCFNCWQRNKMKDIRFLEDFADYCDVEYTLPECVEVFQDEFEEFCREGYHEGVE
jgi:hypothetical protein